MPSTSKAQFRKMEQLFSQGQITREQLDNFNHGVDYAALPEHVAPVTSHTLQNPLKGKRRPRRP